MSKCTFSYNNYLLLNQHMQMKNQRFIQQGTIENFCKFHQQVNAVSHGYRVKSADVLVETCQLQK